MDLKELQAILQKEKGKIIIVENGAPVMVILPYETYKNQVLKSPQEQREEMVEEQEPESDELTLDDLPL